MHIHIPDSDMERLLIWRGAIRAWWHHPLIGYGLDNFIEGFRANRGQDYVNLPGINGSQTSMQADAHNIFLQVLVTSGILGITCFVYCLKVVWSILETRKKESDWARCVRACLISLFVGSLFEPVSFSCWVLAAMLLGSIL